MDERHGWHQQKREEMDMNNVNLVFVALLTLGLSLKANALDVKTDSVVSSKGDVDSICVVNNNDMPEEIQERVHSSIEALGIESHSVGTPMVSGAFGCDVYAIFGGKMGWDLKAYMNQFRFTVYDAETHEQLGTAQSSISEWAIFKRYKAGPKMIDEAIQSVL